jgi:hypothetical protein
MGQSSAGESLLKKSIVTSTSIDFRPFHIKLGLWNILLRLWIKIVAVFLLKNKFPRINKARVNEINL